MRTSCNFSHKKVELSQAAGRESSTGSEQVTGEMGVRDIHPKAGEDPARRTGGVTVRTVRTTITVAEEAGRNGREGKRDSFISTVGPLVQTLLEEGGIDVEVTATESGLLREDGRWAIVIVLETRLLERAKETVVALAKQEMWRKVERGAGLPEGDIVVSSPPCIHRVAGKGQERETGGAQREGSLLAEIGEDEEKGDQQTPLQPHS